MTGYVRLAGEEKGSSSSSSSKWSLGWFRPSSEPKVNLEKLKSYVKTHNAKFNELEASFNMLFDDPTVACKALEPTLVARLIFAINATSDVGKYFGKEIAYIEKCRNAAASITPPITPPASPSSSPRSILG